MCATTTERRAQSRELSLWSTNDDSSSARATVALAAVATQRRSAARRDRQRGRAVEALTIVLRGTTELAMKSGGSVAAGAGVRAVEAPSVRALVRAEGGGVVAARAAHARGAAGASRPRAATRGGNVRPDRRIARAIAREVERVARAARVQQRRTGVRRTPASAARAETRVGCKRQFAGSHGARNARARCLASRSSCDVRGPGAPAAPLRDRNALLLAAWLQGRWRAGREGYARACSHHFTPRARLRPL